MKKTLLTIIGIFALALIVLLYPWIGGYLFRDINPIEDKDLLYKQREVSSEDNAYNELTKLSEALEFEDAKKDRIIAHLNNAEWDEKFVKKILLLNNENLKHFVEAGKKPTYQNPIYTNLTTVDLNNILSSTKTLEKTVMAARLATLETMLLARQGEPEQAMHNLLQILKLNESIQKSEGTLIDKLITITVDSMALEGIKNIAKNYSMPKTTLVLYAKQLTEYEDVHLEEAYKGEYLLFTTLLSAVKDDPAFGKMLKWAPKFYFHPNKTKQMAAVRLRELISLSKIPCNKFQGEKKEFSENTSNAIRTYFTENAIGENLNNFLAINTNAIKRKCGLEENFAEVRTSVLSPLPHDRPLPRQTHR